MKRTIQLAVACLAFTIAAPDAISAPVTLPSSTFDSVEGNSQSVTPFDRTSQLQQIYDSSLFAGSPIQITGLRVRQGSEYTGSSPFTSSSFRIDVSSSAATSSSFSNTFSTNHGVDLTTVFNGALSLAFSGGSSPNAFSDLITFSSPFMYDPSSGRSLVLHLSSFNVSSGELIVDREVGANAAGTVFLWNPNETATTASFSRASDSVIFQLETGSGPVVPEPSTFALLGIGSVCMGFVGVRRRKNKAA